MRRFIVRDTSTQLLPLALFGLVGLAGCGQALNRAPIHEAYRISDWPGFNNIYRGGNLYFAGQPSEAALRQAPERDIKVVVNLRTDAEMVDKVGFDEAATVRDLGVSYASIPVTPATFSARDAEKLDEVLRNTTGPVLIHCHSANRAGALWALYLYEFRGVALPEAIELGRSAGAKKAEAIELIKRTAATSTERVKQ